MLQRTLILFAIIAPPSFSSPTLPSPQDGEKKEPTLTIGDAAPAVQISRWLKGKKFSKKDPPKDFVLTFVAADETGKQVFATLGRISKDFKASGMRVLAVLPPIQDLPVATARDFVKASTKKMRFSVGLDKEGRTRKAWLEPVLAKDLPHSVIVIDRHIVWEGQPSGVLYDNVEAALDGKIDLGHQWVLRNRKEARPFGMALLGQDFEKAASVVDGFLGRFPESAHFHALKFVALSRTKDAETRCKEFFEKSLERLRESNGHAAIILITKVFDKRRSDELTSIALATLDKLSRPEGRFAGDALAIKVQLLDQQKKYEEAKALAKTTFIRCKDRLPDLRTLTAVLVGSDKIEIYKDLLLEVLEKRVALEPTGEDRDDALYLRWQVLAYVIEDVDATKKAAKMALEQIQGAESLNGIVWALLTEKAYGPAYLDLAMVGVDRMLKIEDLGYNEIDTAALAYFKKGDKAKAVSLQERALKKAKAEEYIDDSTLKEFEEKLEKYKK